MLDNTGRIISWNMSAERMMGYGAKEVLGKNYSIFFSKEEIRQEVFIKALAMAAQKGGFTAEGIRVRKDGSHFWARVFITRVREGKRGATFFVLVTQDITQQKAREKKREEYIGIASHEMKNPITTLALYSELLAKGLQLESDKKNLHMLRDMQTQTARLTRLVEDLLVVSKLESGTLELRKEVFNPSALVTMVIRDFQNSAPTHKIICKKGTLGFQVRADRARIVQVLINLLTNAVKYSPRSNKVLVRVGARKNKCIISVEDFGTGIGKKDQRKIFTRFFRGDDTAVVDVAGTGLGLYISREIMKRHHERLTMKSVVGRGTTFSFTLSSS